MYRVGHRKRNYRTLLVIISLLLLAALAAGGVALKHAMQDTTAVIGESASVVKTVEANTLPTRRVDEQLFVIDLPREWKLTSHETKPLSYTWQGTLADDSARQLSLYIDDTPATMPVNRMLPVQGNHDHVDVIGQVSDNCADFTGAPGDQSQQTLSGSQAKWGGIVFLCDMTNTARNVVGTSSQDGINKVIVTGNATGRHSLFFVYTDHTSNPDYSVLTSALQSFRLK